MQVAGEIPQAPPNLTTFGDILVGVIKVGSGLLRRPHLALGSIVVFLSQSSPLGSCS